MVRKPLAANLMVIAGVNFLSSFNPVFFCAYTALLIHAHAPIFERQALDVLFVAAVFTAPLLVTGVLAHYFNTRFSTRNVIVFAKIVEVLLALSAAVAFGIFQDGGSYLPLLVIAALLGAEYSIYRPALKCYTCDTVPRPVLAWASSITETCTFTGIVAGTVLAVFLLNLTELFNDRPEFVGLLFALFAVQSLFFATRLDTNLPRQRRMRFKELSDEWYNDLRRQSRYHELVLAGISESYIFSAIILSASMAIHYIGVYLERSGSAGQLHTYAIMASPVLGAAAGCFCAGLLSRKKIEIGLVPPAAVGMIVSGLLVSSLPYYTDFNIESGLLALLLAAYGFCAGITLVPMQAWQAFFVKPSLRSTFFSWFYLPFGVGILSSVAVVFVMYICNWQIFTVNLTLAIITLVLGAVTFYVMPQFLLRMLMLILIRTLYRLRIYHPERIPEVGPALLVANRASFVDILFISACTSRPIRFMIHERYFRFPLLHRLYESVGFLEVPGVKPKKLRRLMFRTRELLRAGEVICVFPEGDITRNGVMSVFRGGIAEMLPDDTPVPVIPMRVGMTWGSIFSCYYGRFRLRWPNELPHPATVTVGEPIPPSSSSFEMLIKLSELAAETELIPWPGERPFHAQFAAHAKRHPLGCMVREFNGVDTESDNNITQLTDAVLLSRYLRQVCVPAEKNVGVMLPNSVAAVRSVLAIMMADRTPAVLNYTASAAALQHAIEKAGLKHILTTRSFMEKIGMTPLPQMVMIDDDEVRHSVPGVTRLIWRLATWILPSGELMKLMAPESWNDVSRTAGIIFSSGSTGIPKGIMLTHHNINADVTSIMKVVGWNKRDRILGNLPIFHSFGFAVCMWLPVVSGCETTMIPNAIDGAAAGKVLSERKVTILASTPSFLQIYMRKCSPSDFESLHLVIAGAEKLRDDIVERFYKMTGITISEAYGCSELSPVVSINLANSLCNLGIEPPEAGSIGPALPGICVKIVDPVTFEMLPENTDGLLVVKGATVMKGYLDDPEKTSEVIRDNWYITGDIAHMSRSGYITITGRISRFSKIAGEMVPHELVEREINQILCPDDRLFAVCGAKDPQRGEKLVVLYTDPERLAPDQVIRELRNRSIPNLWIPKAENFIRVDSLPMLGSGKLDLSRLSAMAEELAGN